MNKLLHTQKIDFKTMMTTDDLRLNPSELEQWLKVFPELADDAAVAINKVQTWMIWGVRTPRYWHRLVSAGMPHDMWPLPDPPPLVLHERLGIDLTTAVDWRIAGFDENIDEKFYDLWLKLDVTPQRASNLFYGYGKWRRVTGELDGDLRVTMPLLKLFGIHLSIENFVKYRNLGMYRVAKRKAKETRRANRWYRIFIIYHKPNLKYHIPCFINRLFYKFWPEPTN